MREAHGEGCILAQRTSGTPLRWRGAGGEAPTRTRPLYHPENGSKRPRYAILTPELRQLLPLRPSFRPAGPAAAPCPSPRGPVQLTPTALLHPKKPPLPEWQRGLWLEAMTGAGPPQGVFVTTCVPCGAAASAALSLRVPSSRPTFSKAAMALSRWARVWAAESCTRMRALPCGTTG